MLDTKKQLIDKIQYFLFFFSKDWYYRKLGEKHNRKIKWGFIQKLNHDILFKQSTN